MVHYHTHQAGFSGRLLPNLMNKLIYFLLMVLPLCTGCSDDLCRVGSTRISAKDLSLRAKVSEIYYPGSAKDYVALSQLIKGNLALEILRSSGHPVDAPVLESEAKRIDENTKAPEMLAKIKSVYGADRKTYLRTFVAPVYAERMLYSDVFLKSPDIHAATRTQAEALLREVSQAPASFSKIAQQSGAPVALLRISRSKGIRPDQNQRMQHTAEPIGIEQAKYIIPLLAKLSPGNMLPQPIDSQETFQVMRFMKKAGPDFIVEAATNPKRTFDDWFWEQAPKVHTRIRDAALKEELLKEVSWARKLSLE